METNFTRTGWRQITATAIGAGAIAVGALVLSAPTANAESFQTLCTTKPTLYNADAATGVYSTVRRDLDRDEICKLFNTAGKHLSSWTQTNYGWYIKHGPVVPPVSPPPAQSPR